jgi:hypothetical protein
MDKQSGHVLQFAKSGGKSQPESVWVSQELGAEVMADGDPGRMVMRRCC